MTRASPESGQASVELVAVIPFVVLAALAVWQIALAGHTLWLTAGAARAAARADTVGSSPERAARSALPDAMERVNVNMPLLLRRWRSPVEMTAVSSLGRER